MNRSAVFLALSAALLSACAPRAVGFVNRNYDSSRIRHVALLHFEDYPGLAGSGEIAASTFEKNLLLAGYTLVERRRVDKVLKEQFLDLSGAIEPAVMRRLGKILGVDALVLGSLTDFSNIREQTVYVNMPQHQSEPIFDRVVTTEKNKNTTVRTEHKIISGYSTSVTQQIVPRTETLPARAGMSVRLVEVASGEVLWSASASGNGPDLTTATQKASFKLMQTVTKELRKTEKKKP